MVPAHLLFLAKLPLTANGKLDRRCNRMPVEAQRVPRATSELEQRIAAIWADVLKLERVGLGDNFELGGHSACFITQVELGTILAVVPGANAAGLRSNDQ